MLFHTFHLSLHWEYLWTHQHLMFLGEVSVWITTHNHNAQIEIVCPCAHSITSICKVGVGFLAKAGDRWTNTFLQPWISGAQSFEECHLFTFLQVAIVEHGLCSWDSMTIVIVLHPTERGSSFLFKSLQGCIACLKLHARSVPSKFSLHLPIHQGPGATLQKRTHLCLWRWKRNPGSGDM